MRARKKKDEAAHNSLKLKPLYAVDVIIKALRISLWAFFSGEETVFLHHLVRLVYKCITIAECVGTMVVLTMTRQSIDNEKKFWKNDKVRLQVTRFCRWSSSYTQNLDTDSERYFSINSAVYLCH